MKRARVRETVRQPPLPAGVIPRFLQQAPAHLEVFVERISRPREIAAVLQDYAEAVGRVREVGLPLLVVRSVAETVAIEVVRHPILRQGARKIAGELVGRAEV